MEIDDPEWLPVRLLDHLQVVEWMNFAQSTIENAFLDETVSDLRAHATGNSQWTPVESLRKIPWSGRKAGFVFHISRCGSTLLANLFRSSGGAVVFSEPQILRDLLKPGLVAAASKGLTAIDERALAGAVSAFTSFRRESESPAIVKVASWHLAQADIFHRLWPEIPAVIVVRDPLEVAVSCLQGPPGWMRWKLQDGAPMNIFGWPSEELASMSAEEYCAKVLGVFFDAALRLVESAARVTVLDYSEIKVENAATLLRTLDVVSTDLPAGVPERTFALHAKSSGTTEPFQPDSERKRQLASPQLRDAVERFAARKYTALLEAATARKKRLNDKRVF